MSKLFLSGLVAFVVPVAAAQAQDMSISLGATVTSEYISNGIRYSDGMALQPYVELGFGGIFAGAYASNVDADLTGADIEYGLSLGYRGEVDTFSYDIGLSYYIFEEAFSDFPVEASGEASASGTLAVSDTFYATAKAVITPEYDQAKLSLRGDYYNAIKGLSAGAIVGRVESNCGDWDYWSVDVAYSVSEQVSLGLAYHDTNLDPDLGLADTDGLFVA